MLYISKQSQNDSEIDSKANKWLSCILARNKKAKNKKAKVLKANSSKAKTFKAKNKSAKN